MQLAEYVLGGMRLTNSYKGAGEVLHKWRTEASGLQPWELRWQPVCSSTEVCLSKWLSQDPWNESSARAFLAAKQRFAFGQHGRSWHSPKGGVWISAAIPWSGDQESSGLLGLTVAVALAERLELKGVQVSIKWPNDLFVSGRKLAGFLPRLIHRGNKLRLARIGLGLNVCNRVPQEGIALLELLLPGQTRPVDWTVEVLWALNRAISLSNDPEWVCAETQRRLWKTELRDSKTDDLWKIVGITKDGALNLQNGSKEQILRRWN